MFAAARQITGWSGLVGEAGPVLELGEGYRGVTAGSGGGGRGRVGSHDLKKPFPLKCLPACTPANTITSLVGSAS